MAIECDSSEYAVGGTLMQKMKGLWHPVAYFSKKLNPAESNYSIHDKEILAIIRSICEWRTELVGQYFEVWSDHRNLAYFQKKQHLGEKQDIPYDVDDDRIANRHHQLLEGDTKSLKVVAKTTWIRDRDADSDKELMAPTSMMTPHPICPFVEENMIALWDAALQANHRYWKS